MDQSLPRTFVARKNYRWKCLAFVIGFLAVLVASVIGFTIDPPRGVRFNVVPVVAAFWGVFILIAVYSWLDATYGAWEVSEDGVTKQGWLSNTAMAFEEVNTVFWGCSSPGSVALTSPSARVRIDLDWFEAEERLWWIRLIRQKVHPSREMHWEIFCRTKALPLRERVEGTIREATPEEIKQSRELLNWLYLPMLALSTISAPFIVWKTNNWRSVALPILTAAAYYYSRSRTRPASPIKVNADTHRIRIRQMQMMLGVVLIGCIVVMIGLRVFPPQVKRISNIAVVIALLLGAVKVDLSMRPYLKDEQARAMAKWEELERNL